MSWANFSKIDQAERKILEEQDDIKNLVSNILSNQKPFLMQTTIDAAEFEGINPGFKIDGKRLIYSDHMIPVANKIDMQSAVNLIQNLDEVDPVDTQAVHYDEGTNCFFISCVSSNMDRLPSRYFLIKVSAEDYAVVDKKEIPIFYSEVSKTFVWDQENIYVLTHELKFQAYQKSNLDLLWEMPAAERNGFIATCDELDIVLFRDGNWSSMDEIKAYNKTNGVEVWTNNNTVERPHRIMDMALTPEGKAVLYGLYSGSPTQYGGKWCEWDTRVSSPPTFVVEDTNKQEMDYYNYVISPDGKFGLCGRKSSNSLFYYTPNYETENLDKRAVTGITYSTSQLTRHIAISKNYIEEGAIAYFYNSASKFWDIVPLFIEQDNEGKIVAIKTAKDDYTLEESYQRIYVNAGSEFMSSSIYVAREFGVHNGTFILKTNSTTPGRSGTFIIADYQGFSHSASVFYKHIENTKAPTDLKIWAFVEADLDLNEGEAWYSFNVDQSKTVQTKESDAFGEKNYEEIVYSGQRLVTSNRQFTTVLNEKTREIRINNALQSEILWINKIEIDGTLLFSEEWTFNKDNNRVVKFNKEIEQGSQITIYYDLKFIDNYLPIYIHTKRDDETKIAPVINAIILGYEI